jgi:centromeric protein E
MDVRNVDPEEALVDYQMVDAADISVDMDESFVRESGDEDQDKILVSIRCAH